MFMEGLIRLVQKGHTSCQTGIERRYAPAPPCEWWDLWDRRPGPAVSGPDRIPSRDVHSTSEATRADHVCRESAVESNRAAVVRSGPVPRFFCDSDLNTEDGRSSDFARSTFALDQFGRRGDHLVLNQRSDRF